MKKCVLILCLCMITSTNAIYSQQEKTIKENVLVVNAQIPVRVFHKGQPVDNLTKDDFLLFEGKKPKTINGFFLKKRKIGGQQLPPVTKNKTAAQLRYFVLNFRINQYDNEIQKGLRYMFDNILREDDQLMVLVNDKQISFSSLPFKNHAITQIQKLLETESVAVRSRLLRDMQQVKTETMVQYQRFSTGRGSIEAAWDVLKLQRKAWLDHHRNYIVPEMLKYTHLASHLEYVKKQKWVINFYQANVFPLLKESGPMNRNIQSFITKFLEGGLPHERRNMDQMYNRLDKEINEAALFMVGDVSKLFYRVDAAYHAIMIPYEMNNKLENYEFRVVPTPIGSSFKRIAAETGGALIDSPDIAQSLEKIKNKESLYYLLTYVPDNPGKLGKITVKTTDRKYKIVYDDNTRTGVVANYLEKNVAPLPMVQLSGFTIKNKVLLLAVKDFLVPVKTSDAKAKINIHLLIKDQQNNVVYDKNRFMVPSRDSVEVSIPFKWLKKGEYYILGEVRDMLTGSTDVKFLQPMVQ